MKSDRQIGNTCNSYLIIPQIPPLRLPNRDDDRIYSPQTKCSNCRQSPEIHHLGEQAVTLRLGIILWFAIVQIIHDEEGNPFLICIQKISSLKEHSFAKNSRPNTHYLFQQISLRTETLFEGEDNQGECFDKPPKTSVPR